MSETKFALSTRVVLITGATSGIGRACAELLASSGWRVFGTGRSLSSALPPAGHVEMVEMDVDDDASVHAGVATVIAKAGRLDAVINNAGFSMRGAVEDTAIVEAKAIFETNFFGVLRVCRAVMPALRANGGGYIVNIGSLAGVVGLPFSGLYSASKFALEGVSASLRLETRPFGIHVVLVEPGDFRTQITVNRHLAAPSQKSVYRAAFYEFMDKRGQNEAAAPTPEPVARLVEHILNHHSPKMRYSVGRLGQRILVQLKRLLPQRVFEWLFCRAMGL